MIGIIGGMGPAAGVELARLVVEQDEASTDQDHKSFILMSAPAGIGDRSRYLEGLGEPSASELENPGIEIARLARELLKLHVLTIGIPCNTAHAPEILEPVREAVGHQARLVHLIEATATEVVEQVGPTTRVGVLSTLGTKQSGLYQAALAQVGVHDVVVPNDRQQHSVDLAIAQVKAGGQLCPQNVLGVTDELRGHGATIFVLGCTELPLLFSEACRCARCAEQTSPMPTFINPLEVMARELLADPGASRS